MRRLFYLVVQSIRANLPQMDDGAKIPANGIMRLAAELRSGHTTAVDLAEAVFERIEALEPKLNAFVSLTKARAIKEAQAADERLARDHDAPLLCGIPYAAKDIFDVEGEFTQCGCPVLSDNRANSDSNAVDRMSDAGMVLVGKTRTSPLACETSGINHSEVPARNPWKKEPHIAGGSSSGSAVAVAAGIVPVALGSDTGGSVRVPAALCGVTGHKTTLGEIGRGGVLPLADSFDTVGTLARSSEDARLVFDILRGEDSRDSTTRLTRHESRGEKPIAKCRVVMLDGPFFDAADSEIRASVLGVADTMKSMGAMVERREVPLINEAMELNERDALMDCEAWINNREIFEKWGDKRDWLTNWMDYGKTVDPGHLTEYRALQSKFQQRFREEEKQTDIFLAPTVRMTTRPIELLEADYARNIRKYVGNTVVGNFLNLCGLSVPSGLDAYERPIGTMILAHSFNDPLVLSVGTELQSATFFTDFQPELAK